MVHQWESVEVLMFVFPSFEVYRCIFCVLGFYIVEMLVGFSWSEHDTEVFFLRQNRYADRVPWKFCKILVDVGNEANANQGYFLEGRTGRNNGIGYDLISIQYNRVDNCV